MSTNDTTTEETVKTESEVVEELRQAKEAETTKVETPEVPVAPEVVDPKEVVQPELTTQPQEPEKDLEWYKKAYDESTKEALRLKVLADAKPPEVPESPALATLTPEQLYIKQKQDEEIANAFSEITKNYPQVSEPDEYKKFTSMATTFGKTILDAEGRLATPAELYSKTVIALGWTSDDNREKLGAALREGAGSPRVSSGSTQPRTQSKVTDEMILANRKMYPGKSDSQIREELEPHVQA